MNSLSNADVFSESVEPPYDSNSDLIVFIFAALNVFKWIILALFESVLIDFFTFGVDFYFLLSIKSSSDSARSRFFLELSDFFAIDYFLCFPII